MRILLSNDDGILAPGLAALHAAVKDLGEVIVVAPDSPQSAAGHSITLQQPLIVRRLKVGEGCDSFQGISVSGRPADCVRLAVKNLMADPPDLVLSGINEGANVGINVFYSGTVAAAAEAAMCGFPAIAFSARMTGDVDFSRIAGYCRWALQRLLTRGVAHGDLINVNIPTLTSGRPLGVRVVPQSTLGVEDVYQKVVDVEGRESYRLGDEYRWPQEAGETDVSSLSEGYITITPLHTDMTRHDRLYRLAQYQWDGLPDEKTER